MADGNQDLRDDSVTDSILPSSYNVIDEGIKVAALLYQSWGEESMPCSGTRVPHPFYFIAKDLLGNLVALTQVCPRRPFLLDAIPGSGMTHVCSSSVLRSP